MTESLDCYGLELLGADVAMATPAAPGVDFAQLQGGAGRAAARTGCVYERHM
ncbi:MAG: hypothetical protein ING49_15820 [Rubrivivax sp.]|nr:hypothetical protein [Rubrivivax sp.]MCA3258206.1 hypothetical protein [Rubrivivax sp.]